MRILQVSRTHLAQVIAVLVSIVIASCWIFTIPKHIEVSYPVVYDQAKQTVQSPVLNSFNRELWLNTMVEVEVPFSQKGTFFCIEMTHSTKF